MPDGTGLLEFMRQYPSRTFDVGIAEEHAVSMAGGLAKAGMIPVVALYSTFLQRSYDQILQDIAMLKLHVVLAIDRAGLVGEDGQTHHGTFDMGFLRHAPGMQILCPASCEELRRMLKWAVRECGGPVAVRYPRGSDGLYTAADWQPDSDVVVHADGTDCAIVTYGTLVNNVLEAAEILEKRGISAKVVRLGRIAPLDQQHLQKILGKTMPIYVVEEAQTAAAVHPVIAALFPGRVTGLDLGSEYVTQGNIKQLYQHYGLDGVSVAQKIMEVQRVEK
jgi:1-deoxy-D-xylulose-5-phosphate synthase